jgi:hypothetical protein
MSQASYEKSTSVAILCKGIINSLLGVLHIIGSYTFEAQAIGERDPPHWNETTWCVS